MATRKEILVKRYIEQVRNGSHYKGHVVIADTKLDYELVFPIPITALLDMPDPKDVNEIRDIFQLTVKRDDVNIELTDDEYGFFSSTVVNLAIDFYFRPEVRVLEEEVMDDLLRSCKGIVTSASIGMTNSGLYEFSPELCEMLSAPKFGCALLD